MIPKSENRFSDKIMLQNSQTWSGGRPAAALFRSARMLITRLAAAAAFASLAAGFASAASEPPPGASSCSGCHPASSAVESPVPRLAGRNAAELVAQMQAFRSGRQPATVMDRIAKGFTEAETAAIAAWYSEQK
jgi:sulfide dehydrogenase cytochrome subunit